MGHPCPLLEFIWRYIPISGHTHDKKPLVNGEIIATIFQLNEVIRIDGSGEDSICFKRLFERPLYIGFLRRAPLSTYRAHYADNYCHRMAATNVLVIIVSKRANVFSALASFVKNQIPE